MWELPTPLAEKLRRRIDRAVEVWVARCKQEGDWPPGMFNLAVLTHDVFGACVVTLRELFRSQGEA